MSAFKILGTLCILILFIVHNEARRASLRANHMVQHAPHIEPQASVAGGRPTPEAYNSLRDIFFRYEESKTLGADITLTQKELQANQLIMEAKTKEYEEGLATPHLFTPSQHLFEVLDDIKQSPLFKYISSMPKGAVLHAHDTALCSTDFLIKLTYRDNLWVCQGKGDKEVIGMRFSKTKPAAATQADCTWELLSKVRELHGADKVDTYLREHLTLYPTVKFLDNNEAWEQFSGIFALLDGLLLYAPSWADYYYNALKEFHDDGVQYLEFRTTLPIVSIFQMYTRIVSRN